MMHKVWITREEFQKAEEHYHQTGWIDWRLSCPDPMAKVKLKFKNIEWEGDLYNAPKDFKPREWGEEPLASHWMPLCSMDRSNEDNPLQFASGGSARMHDTDGKITLCKCGKPATGGCCGKEA